uniref:Secreted protein n=1 Tax=Arundo donax TaxID=35708 RepID=A0A0A9BJP8_ARUDO
MFAAAVVLGLRRVLLGASPTPWPESAALNSVSGVPHVEALWHGADLISRQKPRGGIGRGAVALGDRRGGSDGCAGQRALGIGRWRQWGWYAGTAAHPSLILLVPRCA